MKFNLLQLIGARETLKVKFHQKRGENEKTIRDWESRCQHSASIEPSQALAQHKLQSTWVNL